MIDIRWQFAFSEWRPECSDCGWIGSYWKDDEDAEAEGRRHVRTRHADDEDSDG